jgi:hypothetical protein
VAESHRPFYNLNLGGKPDIFFHIINIYINISIFINKFNQNDYFNIYKGFPSKLHHSNSLYLNNIEKLGYIYMQC